MLWMKRVMLVSFVLLAAASGQPRIENAANSAPGSGGLMYVNADCSAPDQDGVASARLFYSLDYQSSWTETEMNRIGTPGYDSTFAQSIALPGSGGVFYYLRCSDGERLATLSPTNGANVWPVPGNLLALAADDPAGDVQSPEGPYLDLTGAHVGCSSDRFYARLTNNHDSWPTSGGALGPWFIYSIGFVNPEAPSDSWVFSLSYASVPFAFSTGLYLINRFTADYSKIAEIDAVPDGNELLLRCLQSDMAGHPRFGPWPNSSGYLTVAANTQSIRISGATLRDTTAPADFYPLRTPFPIVGQNHPPSVYRPGAAPGSGTPETEFRFSCRYSDPDSNLPVVHAVVVDSDTFPLQPAHHRYWEETSFNCTRSGFGIGRHHYRFVFDDGMTRVASQADSFLVTATGIGEPAFSSRVSIWPNPARRMMQLELPPGCANADLLDCAGRKLGALRPGVNDIGRFNAGVYFLRVPGSGRPVRVVILN